MNKHSFYPSNIVTANKEELQFYTESLPQGIVTTTLWKYNIKQNELHACYSIRERIEIYRYMANDDGDGLQYIGICSQGAAAVIGLDLYGNTLFRYAISGYGGAPVYDTTGNIYVSVNNVWIICLNGKGELVWKWRPRVDDLCNARVPNPIKNYRIYNEKLYVIAVGREFVVSLDGKTEKIKVLAGCHVATCFEGQEDKIFFAGVDLQKLYSYNLNAGKLWEYCVEKNEKIQETIVNKDTAICLRVTRKPDFGKKWYFIDTQGKKQWETVQEWTRVSYISEDSVVLIADKTIAIFDNQGTELLQYCGKEYILWGRLLAENLVMIVERRGNIAIVVKNRNLCEKEKVVEIASYTNDDKLLSAKEIKFWQDELSEYLLLNLQIWKKYYGTEILEISLSYEPYEKLEMKVLNSESVWVNGMAGNIPYEKRKSKDRDVFKECACRAEILWIEFCNACPFNQIPVVMEKICELLREKVGVLVRVE